MSAVLADAESPLAPQRWLTMEQMRNICSRVTYREGWRVYVSPGVTGGLEIVWEGPVKDALNRPNTQHLRLRQTIYVEESEFTEEQFKRILLAAAMVTEVHEAKEFFRFDGKQIFDPHRTERGCTALPDLSDPDMIVLRSYYV